MIGFPLLRLQLILSEYNHKNKKSDPMWMSFSTFLKFWTGCIEIAICSEASNINMRRWLYDAQQEREWTNKTVSI